MIPFPPRVRRGALDDGLTVLAEDAGVGVGSGRARRGCSPPQVGIRRLAKLRLTMLMKFWRVEGWYNGYARHLEEEIWCWCKVKMVICRSDLSGWLIAASDWTRQGSCKMVGLVS